MSKLPSDYPLFDSAGRRVWWVYLQPRDDNQPCQGFIDCQKYDYNLGKPEDIGNRPCFSDLGLNKFHLTDDIHSWFVDQDIKYVLEYRWHEDRLGWHIGLRNPESAILVKLTWGTLGNI